MLNEKVAEIDRLIENRFRAHDLAELATSMPGTGSLLGAELLAGVGSDLASFAGLAPPWVPGSLTCPAPTSTPPAGTA
ncbi:hypothetical protein [Streptomyces sp. 061-3]|uniref:hypothetical protein n=1 Tax=Streptomyces sp. 061-3 TaxID=2789268 RepID=UPI0039801A9F